MNVESEGPGEDADLRSTNGPPESLGPSGRNGMEQRSEEGREKSAEDLSNGSTKRQRVRIDRDTVVEIESSERNAPIADESPEVTVGDRIKRPPKAPSAEEWRRHRATHVPFRSWCPKCVAGRAVRGDHSEAEAPIDETPQVSMDYCFLRGGPMVRRVCLSLWLMCADLV